MDIISAYCAMTLGKTSLQLIVLETKACIFNPSALELFRSKSYIFNPLTLALSGTYCMRSSPTFIQSIFNESIKNSKLTHRQSVKLNFSCHLTILLEANLTF